VFRKCVARIIFWKERCGKVEKKMFRGLIKIIMIRAARANHAALSYNGRHYRQKEDNASRTIYHYNTIGREIHHALVPLLFLKKVDVLCRMAFIIVRRLFADCSSWSNHTFFPKARKLIESSLKHIAARIVSVSIR
jgi:hypothetical protein